MRRKRDIRRDNGAIYKTTITTRSNIATCTTVLCSDIPKHQIAVSALHTRTRNGEGSRHAIHTVSKQTIKQMKTINNQKIITTKEKKASQLLEVPWSTATLHTMTRRNGIAPIGHDQAKVRGICRKLRCTGCKGEATNIPTTSEQLVMN